MSEQWERVIATDAVSAGRVVEVDVANDEAVAWRTRSGAPCVMARRCPHLDWDLTDAIVMGDELLCAGHGWSLRADGVALKRNEFGREDTKGTIHTWSARDCDGWIEVERPGAYRPDEPEDGPA
ncbi:MAG TPA: Rieske 2Fe-2S domain-containing protein [Acidimicrobiia bacterium]|nr:Rieske 2Fe-2S domain-containing protein [Acidimicrobiia bacterium]